MRFRNDAASINVYLFVVNGYRFKNPKKFAPHYVRFAQKCRNYRSAGKKYPGKWNDIHSCCGAKGEKSGGQRGFSLTAADRGKNGYSIVLRSPTADGAAFRPLR